MEDRTLADDDAHEGFTRRQARSLAKAAAAGDTDALATIQRAVKATRAPKPKRARREYESPDIAAFLRRQGRGLVKRAGTGDLEALSALLDSIAALEVAAGEAARALVDPKGPAYSWGEVGREVGMTRQAARQRWGKSEG